MIIYMSSNCLA